MTAGPQGIITHSPSLHPVYDPPQDVHASWCVAPGGAKQPPGGGESQDEQPAVKIATDTPMAATAAEPTSQRQGPVTGRSIRPGGTRWSVLEAGRAGSQARPGLEVGAGLGALVATD